MDVILPSFLVDSSLHRGLSGHLKTVQFAMRTGVLPIYTAVTYTPTEFNVLHEKRNA